MKTLRSAEDASSRSQPSAEGGPQHLGDRERPILIETIAGQDSWLYRNHNLRHIPPQPPSRLGDTLAGQAVKGFTKDRRIKRGSSA